jgi:hypothetical protein
MPLRRLLFTALACTLMLPVATAQASTMPRADFPERGVSLAVGIADLSLDVPVGGEWLLGATAYQYVSATFAVRATRRLSGGAGLPSSALTFAVGLEPPIGLSFAGLSSGRGGGWVQPALAWAWPFAGSWVLRATLGPVLYLGAADAVDDTQKTIRAGLSPTLYFLVPGVELAYQINPANEITLLGNSVIGWRGTF